MEEKFRVFIGIPLPEEIKKDLSLWKKELQVLFQGKIKWVEDENLHISLFFIGSIIKKKAYTIWDDITQNSKHFRAFDAQIKGLGFFPSLSYIRVMWAGMGTGRDKVCELYKIIYSTIGRFGFNQEHQEYIPHITLGRAKSKIKIDKSFSEKSWEKKESRVFSIDKLCLIQSVISSKGPEYKVVKEMLLER